MTETAKKSRRWPWLVLIAALLLTGAAVTWQFRPRFRPLNAFELSLLGTWRSSDELRLADEFVLTADRRFVLVNGNVIGSEPKGRWAASPGTLILYFESKNQNPIQMVLSATERFAPKFLVGVVPAGPNQLRFIVGSPPGEVYERASNPVSSPPPSP
jgi:hypothetical protein